VERGFRRERKQVVFAYPAIAEDACRPSSLRR